METLARFFANGWTVIGLIAILVALAYWFYSVYRQVVGAAKLALKEGIRLTESVVGRTEFADKYLEIVDRINTAFAGNQPLDQQWQRFQSQLTRGGEGIILSYREPGDFFNSALLLRDPRLPLCKAGPGYLVGIGLVFTFLGIALVIYRASLALGSNNDLQALHDLLGAASLKFWTSLAGVLLSVLTSAYFRHATARFNVAASDFSYALSTRIQILSQEYSLQCTNLLLERQLEAANDLRTSLLRQDEEYADKVVKELQALREGMVSVTESTFSNLVEKSTSELSAAISQSLQGVAGTFVTINSDLQGILRLLQTLPEQFRAFVTEVASSTQTMSYQTQEAVHQVACDLEAAKTAAEEITSSFSESSQSAGRISEALKGVQGAVKEVSDALARLNQLQEVSQKLQEAAAAVRGSSDALLANWRQQADHVSQIDEKLGGTVATLPGVFLQYSDSLQKFTDQFDSHLGRVLGSLANQIDSLESSQTALRGIAENLYHASVHRNGAAEQTTEVL